LRGLRPESVGRVVEPFGPADDVLDEMIQM
jgi:hypothetical protein